MPFPLFQKVINEISAHPGTALVPFFRGESMLHPQFIEMMAYAKKQGVRPIQYTSNATRMNEKIARAIVDLEIDFISFSVDSIDPDTYARVRPGGNLDKTLKNIAYFCEYKQKKMAKLPEVQVSVVKTPTTAVAIEEFVSFWREKVDRVRVYEAHSLDGNFGSLGGKDDLFVGGRLPCHKPFSDMVVYWNGDVALCNHDWDRKVQIGNVGLTSISEVWNNERYRAIRQAHLESPNTLADPCRRCDHWQAGYMPEGVVGSVYESEYVG
jgi:radical SAM protein with 4Fe4S-binding SPASM domain